MLVEGPSGQPVGCSTVKKKKKRKVKMMLAISLQGQFRSFRLLCGKMTHNWTFSSQELNGSGGALGWYMCHCLSFIGVVVINT